MKPVDLEDLKKKFPDLNKEKIEAKEMTLLERTIGLISGIIPDNVVGVMANSDLIAVITLGAVVGVLAQDTPEKPSVIIKFVNEVTAIVTVVVNFLIKISPFGIFSLIIPHLMLTAVEQLVQFVGWYFITFFSAMGFHLFVVYPAIYFAITRENPWHFFKHFTPTILTALGTGSSAACMPGRYLNSY
jgi:Na+/H+-dicarboxylate symporter